MSKHDDILHYVPRDTTLHKLSAHDLKVMRANMIKQGNYSKYEFACVQYWIMAKEDRLPC